MPRIQRNAAAGNRKDPAWKYGTEVEQPGKGYKYIICNFCEKVIKGGVKRMKEHLAGTHNNAAPCIKVPQDVREEIKEYMKKGTEAKHMRQETFDTMVNVGSYLGSNAPSEGGESSSRGIRGQMDRFVSSTSATGDAVPTPSNPKEMRNLVVMDIARYFIENAIPFHTADTPSFANMLISLDNYGRGFKRPTAYELSSWALQEEVKTTSTFVEKIKSTWPHTGVTIMSDGWKDARGRGLINFLVNNSHGTVYLRSIDASNLVKDSSLLFKLLDDIVEEVGEQHVVQIVIDNASAYKAAGKLLMEKRRHLYWTPCAAHCLDLILERLGELPQHKSALLKAKKVTNFIYNHGWVLATMREFSQKEIIRPAHTRFATAYLTLESILQVRQPLEAMFTSEKWASSVYAKKSDGKTIKNIILRDRIFWKSVSYAIKTTKPLVSVLRLVDSEKEPAMGFIYGAMDKAKEEIAKNLGGEEAAYKEIWEIIDEKWDNQLHHPLHAAAYFLNPRFQYDNNSVMNVDIKKGLFACMERLIADPEERNKADIQIDEFKFQRGFFGMSQAQASYKTRAPADWWSHFGDNIPELRNFAVKILGLTCSSSGCERNWSAFNQIHTKKRNRLSAKKLDDLVYVMYNKKLKDRHLRHNRFNEEDDPLVEDAPLPSDDSWLIDSISSDEGEKNLGEESSSHQIASTSKALITYSKSRVHDKAKGKVPMLEDEEDWDDDIMYDDEDNSMNDSISDDE